MPRMEMQLFGFPATVAALNALTGEFLFSIFNLNCILLTVFIGPQIRAILNALDEPETGTVPIIRKRLKSAVGIVVEVITV